MYDKIIDIIIEEVEEVNESIQEKIPVELRAKAPLFGDTGVLDSIGLVTLIVAVEQSIEDELGTILTLADEKAMSQRNSPFRTVGTLADYISLLLGESSDE